MASGFLIFLDNIATIFDDATVMTNGGGKEDSGNS